jgi:hypothetical protein
VRRLLGAHRLEHITYTRELPARLQAAHAAVLRRAPVGWPPGLRLNLRPVDYKPVIGGPQRLDPIAPRAEADWQRGAGSPAPQKVGVGLDEPDGEAGSGRGRVTPAAAAGKQRRDRER